MLTVEIPIPTPSLNRLHRMHWGQRSRLRDQYETLFRIATSPTHRALKGEHRSVRIERHAPRFLDHDNFVGGCKALVDAMQRARLIWDDSPDYLTVDYIQTKAPAKRSKTVVVIE